ncbi:hypothetical protein ROZALSC1DRAFT_25263, partial [Rozella allomycis CSF55]
MFLEQLYNVLCMLPDSSLTGINNLLAKIPLVPRKDFIMSKVDEINDSIDLIKTQLSTLAVTAKPNKNEYLKMVIDVLNNVEMYVDRTDLYSDLSQRGISICLVLATKDILAPLHDGLDLKVNVLKDAHLVKNLSLVRQLRQFESLTVSFRHDYILNLIHLLELTPFAKSYLDTLPRNEITALYYKLRDNITEEAKIQDLGEPHVVRHLGGEFGEFEQFLKGFLQSKEECLSSKFLYSRVNKPYRIVDREKAMATTLALMFQRYISENDDIRHKNHIFAVYSTPGKYFTRLKLGMGKTLFLSHISQGGLTEYAQRPTSDLDDIMLEMGFSDYKRNPAYRKFLNFLESYVYLPISFNGDTAFEDENPEEALAQRILYSYFVDPKKLPYDSFQTTMKQLNMPDDYLTNVLNLIMQHSGRNNLFLLLDEVNKAEEKSIKILSLIAKHFLNKSNNMAIVSSLDSSPLKSFVAKSGRPTK